MAAFAFMFAPQLCNQCSAPRPLSELEPLTAPNGVLIGWKCAT